MFRYNFFGVSERLRELIWKNGKLTLTENIIFHIFLLIIYPFLNWQIIWKIISFKTTFAILFKHEVTQQLYDVKNSTFQHV